MLNRPNANFSPKSASFLSLDPVLAAWVRVPWFRDAQTSTLARSLKIEYHDREGFTAQETQKVIRRFPPLGSCSSCYGRKVTEWLGNLAIEWN